MINKANTASAASEENAAAELIQVAEPDYPVLLVCDHASNFVPSKYRGLGLTDKQLTSHIAWDIGAADVLRQLALRLNVRAVLGTHSRLLVDSNRNLNDATVIPEISDGVVVPGNVDLTPTDRDNRARDIYWPYHRAINEQLRVLQSQVAAPAIIAIHSFTPLMNGQTRPWHIGALWDKDDRIAIPFMSGMRRYAEVNVGDNEPYSGKHPADFTLDHHAEAAGLPHLAIELRQDLLMNGAEAESWADRLAAVLAEILSDANLYTHRVDFEAPAAR